MNIRDMEDAEMYSRETVNEWEAEFMREYMKPVQDTLIRLTMKSLQKLPQNIQAISRSRQPEAWKVVDDAGKV